MARDKTDKTDLTPAGTPKPKQYNRGKDGTHPLDKSFKPNPEGVVEHLGGDELQSLRVVWGRKLQLFSEGDFWRDLETILANCDEVMLRHDWDRKGGKNFPNDRSAEPFSELWYAGKIGFECWNLLNFHRERGPNEVALSQALYLGRLMSEFEWRAQFKPSIITGKGQRKHLKELRDTKNRAASDGVARRRALIAAIMKEQKRTGGALDDWLRKQLFTRYGITVAARTIRDDRKALRS